MKTKFTLKTLLTAITIISIAFSSSAAITFVEVNTTETSADANLIKLDDMDGDGKKEWRLQGYVGDFGEGYGNQNIFFYSRRTASAQLAITKDPIGQHGFPFATVAEYGSEISNDLNFKQGTTIAGTGDAFLISSKGLYSQLATNNEEVYVPFRVSSNSINWRYGWIKMKFASDFSTYTIISYAIEMKEDKKILAGDEGNGVVIAGVNEIKVNDKISVFPSPSNDVVTIAADNGELINNLTIVTLNGAIVLEKQFNSVSRTNVQVSDLPKGVYLLNIVLSNGESSIERLVKN